MKTITKYLLSGLIIFSFSIVNAAPDSININVQGADGFIKANISLNGSEKKESNSEFKPKSAGEFDDTAYFPGTKINDFGGFGTRGNANEKGDSQMLLYYIPTITNLLLWIVAPLVVAMLLYSGIQFIYAGDDEEQLSSSKKFFQYGIMGIIFILVSYSLMSAIYTIIVS